MGSTENVAEEERYTPMVNLQASQIAVNEIVRAIVDKMVEFKGVTLIYCNTNKITPEIGR
jgi:hypothetical protein